MTKKDFEAIQGALCDGRNALIASLTPDNVQDYVTTDKVQRIHSATCRSIADVLAKQSGKFDRTRFLTGCGVRA